MKKEIKKELQDLNSFLADKKLENNFEVPKNYFNNLQIDLIQKLEIKNQDLPRQESKGFWTRLFSKPGSLRPVISFATIAILAAGAFIWLQPNKQNATLAFQDLNPDEIEQYIENNIDAFDLELLSDSETDLSGFIYTDDDQINDYLKDNIGDFDEQLFDELF